jgi:hypothetical protein
MYVHAKNSKEWKINVKMYSSTFPDFQSHLHKYTLRNTPVNFLSLAFTYFYSAIS